MELYAQNIIGAKNLLFYGRFKVFNSNNNKEKN